MTRTASGPPAPSRPWRRQFDLLLDRSLEIALGEPATLLLLVAQAPLIASLIVLAWSDARETPTLHLFLCLAALWVGCMNACREIVKERPIVMRERRVGLMVTPYVLAKLCLQSGLNVAVAVSLVGIVHHQVGLSGSRIALTIVLWLVATAGTALGLAVSAAVDTSDKAVGLVPLVVLPQILFTRFFLPGGTATGWGHRLENVTILGWGYDLFDRVRLFDADPHWGATFKALAALLALIGALVAFTVAAVWADAGDDR